MIICLKCGHHNPNELNYCKNCNALLPKASSIIDVNVQLKVGRLNQFYEEIAKVKTGKITKEELKNFLIEANQTLIQRFQSIKEVEIPPEIYPDFEEELAIGFSGIQFYEQGIAEMHLYLENENPQHLDRGLELIKEGNDKINEAIYINRRNFEKLEEEAYLEEPPSPF